jgi:hypothetical protein
MRKVIRQSLLYLISLSGMGYAISQLDLPLITPASAAWEKGCCNFSSDCPGKLLCYTRPGTTACGEKWVPCGYDENGDLRMCREILFNYCNDDPFPERPGPGGILE